ncbi:hypothetical protein [Sphingobium yanoikuyae]|uniref:hypothetical protein n=1 Tax=Sphingobium yanoikuyae TaxID=13690 RepID=UPI0028AE3689|nr:hypothetical protein [Sphingobium yanoikuyae]
MATRADLPEWPRLMDAELASAYFGVSAGTFRALGIQSRNIGRRVVWDRVDLDRFADRLSEQPLTETDRAAEASEVERRFLERRRG